MPNFILTKEQHAEFKTVWKQFLKSDAKQVKELVKSGQRNRGYSTSFQILRHMLVCDIDHIESKIVKTFSSQKVGTWDGSAARAGLSDIMYWFDTHDAERFTKRYMSLGQFFQTMDPAEKHLVKKKIVEIATQIHARYVSGAIK